MIPRLTRFLVLLVLIPCMIYCRIAKATGKYPAGSRFAAMANAGVMIPDVWSGFNNQAGLGFLPYSGFSIHHENRFLLPQYASSALAIAIQTKPGCLGGTLHYFGYSKYYELRTGIFFGREIIKNFSVGIQINYHHVQIAQQYGQSSALTVEGGIMVRPIENFYIGFHIFNPSGSSFHSEDGYQKLPESFRFGLGYHLNERIWIVMETHKQSGLKEEWRIGLEVGALENLKFRGGIGNQPFHQTFGLGYTIHGITGDLAFSFHPQLGFTPHFTISYQF